MDRYNIVRDNYYASGCGADRGIGGAEYVDTSCEIHETKYGINYFDTSKEVPVFKGVNDVYSGNLKADHNRTDDPLGADAELLAKSVTTAQLKDGTVTAWLNSAEGSLNNWMQGSESPMLQGIIYPVRLTVCDGYRADYAVGEQLNRSSLSFTITCSDGSTETVSGNDENLIITGFDSSQRAVLTLTASYGAVRTSFTVRILQEDTSDLLTVCFSLMGDWPHGLDADCGVHTRSEGNLQEWIPQTEYQIDVNTTAGDLIRQVLAEKGLDLKGSPNSAYGGQYISGVQIPPSQLENPEQILYLCEKDNGPNAGWMYAVNGKEPSVGVDRYFLDDGDELVLFYSDDFTKEESAMAYQDDPGPDKPDPDKPDPVQPVKITKGKTYTVSKCRYRVTKVAGAKAGTVRLVKAKNVKSFSVPKTIKLADKKTYKVTAVGAKALTGKKIRTVTIGANVSKLYAKAFAGSEAKTVILKTKRLKKTSVKGALKGSKVKTIRVKVGSKAQNKKYVKKYKKIFTRKNTGRKVKVK